VSAQWQTGPQVGKSGYRASRAIRAGGRPRGTPGRFPAPQYPGLPHRPGSGKFLGCPADPIGALIRGRPRPAPPGEACWLVVCRVLLRFVRLLVSTVKSICIMAGVLAMVASAALAQGGEKRHCPAPPGAVNVVIPAGVPPA